MIKNDFGSPLITYKIWIAIWTCKNIWRRKLKKNSATILDISLLAVIVTLSYLLFYLHDLKKSNSL